MEVSVSERGDRMARHLTDIETILGASPFPKVTRTPTEYSISDEVKFEHTWLLAGPGSGKTSFFYREVLTNLAKPNPPAQIIIDPKGTMLDQLSRLKMFDPVDGKHKDRLVIIDIGDFANLPAMNMFCPPDKDRYKKFNRADRQRITNNAINMLSYAFDSRDNSLTPPMVTCFKHACRLLFSFRNTPTMQDLLDVLGEPVTDPTKSKYYAQIMGLPIDARSTKRYMLTKFYKEQKATRIGVENRLHGILADPMLNQIFSAEERKIDLFRYMQERKTVIISVPLGMLDGESGTLIARYMVALTLSAAFERLTIPKDQWTPAFLFCDEFQEVADEIQSPRALRMAREYRLGMFVCCQDVDAIPTKLRSAMSAATGTKYASGLGGVDINFMSKEMRTTPEFLGSIRADKAKKIANFACFVRSDMVKPIIVSIPFGFKQLEALPKMSDDRYVTLLEQNHEKFSITTVWEDEPEIRQEADKPEAPEDDVDDFGEDY
jgi:hypothetical protein